MDGRALASFVASLPGAVPLPHGRLALLDPASAPASSAAAHRLLASWSADASGALALATGGTGGTLKFARHRWSSLADATAAFASHFCIQRVNTFELLPAHHVSGLLSRLRAFTTGGVSVVCDWHDWLAGRFPALPSGAVVCSLVPTQLARLVAVPSAIDFLRRFDALLIGGGPLWPALEEQARALQLPLSPCYGATETAAMVAALRPSEFLAGPGRGVGKPLPHATLSVCAGEGRLCVDSPSLFLGYVGEPDRSGPWVTGDLGHITAEGWVIIAGRADDVVITGGKKVSLSWLEAQLRGRLAEPRLAVIALPDATWGQSLVLCVPQGLPSEILHAALADLAPHQRPKRLLVAPEFFQDARGKQSRPALLSAATDRSVPLSRS
ncbi:AMP-binding protein [Nibricoccus sp. IMCC34717]|uniref:AMP-binding protein n=1 Tax=Nibricoccus sp. IMCC34717 TaxID=3034021 RepID=UPI003851413E